ncbi:hypothetical protein Tco_0381009 [Tanacetum coccineum]
MVEVARRLLRLRCCRSGGCGGAVVMLMAAVVGDERDGDEGGVGGGGAKVEGDDVDVMMTAGWGEAGDAVVYDDGGRQQVAGVWSDSGNGAGVISERECLEEASRISCPALQSFNPGQSFLQSFELHLWPFDQAVMVAPTILVSAEENLRDPIDIRVDIIHLEHIVAVAFPAAVVEELTALRFKVDIAEVENASLRAKIKATEAIEKITRNHGRQVRVKMEQQLAAVQESQCQDREDFRKLKELVTSQFGQYS